MKNDLGTLETVTNNFDLIRLFAASQVAITHTAFHFGITGWIIDLLELFPGVPVFFFISGYLIYGSYENQKNKDRPLLQFYKNRFLRLYPALFGVMTFSLVAFFATGYLSQVDFEVRNLIVWFVAGSAGLQFTPSFLNGYGTGSVNGSLWTIMVELQFYIVTPLVFLLLKKHRNFVLLVLLILVTANIANGALNDREGALQKIAYVTFFPWVYMFIFGAIAYKYKTVTQHVLRPPFWLVLPSYVAVYYLTRDLGEHNAINIISFSFLTVLILQAAYKSPMLAKKTIGKHDISYGIYIYHIPVINIFLYNGLKGVPELFIALIITGVLALISWFVIERPCLKLKRVSLRQV